MDTKDFLNTILNELCEISVSERISNERLDLINKSILRFKNKLNIENLTNADSESIEYDEDYGNSNEDSLYNRPDYNHDMDIDQQGPDFDF